MNKTTLSALLGRPLSKVEDDNFGLYMDLATSRVEDMLCSKISNTFDTLSFIPRKGYKTLNVPIVNLIDSIKLDGVETTKYEARQGSSLNGDWYNSIVFDQPLFCERVEIQADWGFSYTPDDVNMLIAQQFGLVTSTLDEDRITSKQVEDFRITLKDKTKQQAFADKYAATIAKYSACSTGNVQHGNVRRIL